MNDPVSVELAARESVRMPWRWAFFGAVVVHASVAAFIVTSSSGHSRPLSLPKVMVRIGAFPMPMGGTSSAKPASAPSKPVAALSKPVSKPIAVPPRPANEHSGKTVDLGRGSRALDSKAALLAQSPTEPPAADDAGSGQGAEAGQTGSKSPGGAVGLGQGGSGVDENFPYAYYLNRLLALIESNWFKPEAAAGTRCRLRCRIDRSGRLIEVGIEEPSSLPAFDRAALRAIYAAAPFPPMPQGYSGGSLTLHLEFGP